MIGGQRMSGVRVEVTRGGRVESVHEVDVAVMNADGRVAARGGQPEEPAFARSTLKPFQALPLVEDGGAEAFGLSDEELALCCASHSGEPRHVELARGILERAGLGEDALACGPHPPLGEGARRALRDGGVKPGPLHNNCSGKHAGMLLLARHHGWPTEGYHEAEHPVQQRVLDEVARWSGEARDRIGTGVDGCGVVAFALPLTSLAGALARLVEAASAGEAAPARVVGAMGSNPELVAGEGRLCTELMRATGGRVLAKVGAEGVYGAAVLEREWGIALKVRDGARRGAEVALLGVLQALELVTAEELDGVEQWSRPEVRNTRGDMVGGMRSVVALERTA